MANRYFFLPDGSHIIAVPGQIVEIQPEGTYVYVAGDPGERSYWTLYRGRDTGWSYQIVDKVPVELQAKLLLLV